MSIHTETWVEMTKQPREVVKDKWATADSEYQVMGNSCEGEHTGNEMKKNCEEKKKQEKQEKNLKAQRT